MIDGGKMDGFELTVLTDDAVVAMRLKKPLAFLAFLAMPFLPLLPALWISNQVPPWGGGSPAECPLSLSDLEQILEPTGVKSVERRPRRQGARAP
jgi:hypothetical protein